MPWVQKLAFKGLSTINTVKTLNWPDHSRLFLLSDASRWVLGEEMASLSGICSQLGVRTEFRRRYRLYRNQAVFLGDQFSILNPSNVDHSHRIGLAYFHGRPGIGYPEFDELYNRFKQIHHRLDRVQASHKQMRDLILETGIDPAKVHLISIGIDLSLFPQQTAEAKAVKRKELGLPPDAVVIGSFQKDGHGWGEGDEPKLIKGPDVFVKTIGLLKRRIPELHILLGGPARGFVKKGLDKIRVPYVHRYYPDYRDAAGLYQAVDAYLVTSREEGGPKAVLEAMAAGVPLISTRVGQAVDLVDHGGNGWLADVEDIEGLAHWAAEALSRPSTTAAVLARGRQTAEANSYQAQIPLWARLMDGFVGLNKNHAPSTAS